MDVFNNLTDECHIRRHTASCLSTTNLWTGKAGDYVVEWSVKKYQTYWHH